MKLTNRTFFKAIVYSEPTMLGAVKVRIPEIHGIPHSSVHWMKDEQLPYAYPATQFRSEDWGQNIVPLLGTQVYVAFYDDSNLIYFGNALPSSNYAQQVSVRDVFLGNSITMSSPHTIVNRPYQTTLFKSLKGSTIEVSDQDTMEYIKITGPQGGHITIGNNTYIAQRRGNRDITTLFKETPSGGTKEIQLDTYIDLDDGKGNKILINNEGVTINCKKFKLVADEKEGV